MKKLFLTSTASSVVSDIVKYLPRRRLSLVFIKTAAEVEKGDLWWLKKDRKSLVDVGFTVTDYTITGKTRQVIQQDLKKYDILFFSGGNTFYLLEKIQHSGCASVIKDFVESGKIFIGSSAGSIIAGPDTYPLYRLDNVKKATHLKGYEGLSLVDFVVFPHWGTDDFKELYLNRRLAHAYTTKHKIILLTDNQYIRVEGDMYKIVDVIQGKAARNSNFNYGAIER